MAVRKTTPAADGGAITILQLDTGSISVLVKGSSPLIFNSMSGKAKRELLLPKGRKTAADKAASFKHDPRAEFRDSVYKYSDNDHPTRLKFPAPAFKQVLGTSALEVPGAKKAQIGRLTWCEGAYVDIFGIPKLFMSIVRSADMNKTPDVRTRAILHEWCSVITISFVRPTLNEQAIVRLMAAGGLVCGIGDFRQERGAGNFGQYDLVPAEDKTCKRLMETAGREAQDAALAAAEPDDDDTRELLLWYDTEVKTRGRKTPATVAA